MKTIITMPNYDDATAYLYCYAEELVKFAEEKNILMSQLKRPRLRRNILEESIQKQNPPLLLFNAHGDEITIYGDKIEGEEEYLIQEGENHQLLTGKLTYARACSAAASLGKACTQKDGCFIGYNQPFSFWTDTSRTTTPLKDKVAQLFLQPSNELALALLRGKSAREAADTFLNMSKKNILHLLAKQDEPGAMASAMLLWNNMMAQEVLGNEEMRCS
ncbi:hypothetical protein HZC30_00410 [Candidatus Woesearchaeota archaeon]|nr:hypothetical protein [Candidatus Woesearchaeota archaeon]